MLLGLKNMSFIDLTNQRFGRLVALERLEPLKSGDGYRWKCICDCGSICIRKTRLLRHGESVKSCGCYISDLNKAKPKSRSSMNIKHGALSRGKTKEYSIWSSMIQRCTNENHKSYKNYGAKGVTVCSEWSNSFENFLTDMGKIPTNNHTIDRINNTQGYSKDNCRWATYTEQAYNRKNNVFIEIESKKMTIPEVSREYNIPERTLYRWVNENNHETLLYKISERMTSLT